MPLSEVLEATELWVVNQVDEGRVRATGVAGGEVTQVAGSRGNPRDVRKVDALGNQPRDERGRVGVAHPPTLKDKGGVVDGDHRADGLLGGRVALWCFLHASTLPLGNRPTLAYLP